MDSKPIKRSKELLALSREHHHGLLLCWKIRQGLANGVELSRIKEYILHFYDTQLNDHFFLEEKYLFSLIDAQNLHRIKAESQHREIRGLIDAIKANNAGNTSLLGELQQKLEEHIRFEERELFNYIQKHCDSALLKNVAANLDKEVAEMQWDDQFWLKENLKR